MASQKLVVSLEETRDGKVFRYEFPMGVKYQEAYDCCIACANAIVEMSKIAAAAEKKEENKAEKKEGEEQTAS